MTIERRNVGKRLSEAVINRASGTVYLSGQVADEPTADVTGQTQQVLAQIDDLLFEAGSDKAKILSATIYLPDMADFAAVTEVYARRFGEGAPARSTAAVKALPKGAVVEIDAVALAG